jgi:hypothetical protein
MRGEETNEGVLVRCTTVGTSAATLFGAGFSVGAASGCAVSAVESDEEEGEENADYDKL